MRSCDAGLSTTVSVLQRGASTSEQTMKDSPKPSRALRRPVTAQPEADPHNPTVWVG